MLQPTRAPQSAEEMRRGAVRYQGARLCGSRLAQASASWLSGGLLSAPDRASGCPELRPASRPISRLGRAGRPRRLCFRHRVGVCQFWRTPTAQPPPRTASCCFKYMPGGQVCASTRRMARGSCRRAPNPDPEPKPNPEPKPKPKPKPKPTPKPKPRPKPKPTPNPHPNPEPKPKPKPKPKPTPNPKPKPKPKPKPNLHQEGATPESAPRLAWKLEYAKSTVYPYP
eukprot:scaffold9115_cov36-Phaeocystis_antarctica.AAC.1